MAFYGAAFSAPSFAAAANNSAAPAVADFGNFDASRNLFMANADPDYFINPLDDESNCFNNNANNNISFAYNPTLNHSCVWQGFVDDNEEEESFVVAAPSESESRVRCRTSAFEVAAVAEAAAAFAWDSKSCFKRSKSGECSFTPGFTPRTPTPPPTKCCFMPYGYGRGYSSMSYSISGSSIIGGGSHLGGSQQHLLCN